jgi:photosystem II stability/assembly factor-like uncharacterized protein
VSGTSLFAGTGGGGVFRSTSNGASWAASNRGLTGTTVYALAGDAGGILAGTGGGLFRSGDRGASWQTLESLTYPAVALTASGGIGNIDVSGLEKRLDPQAS